MHMFGHPPILFILALAIHARAARSGGGRKAGRASYTVHDSLAELGRLADTAGLRVSSSDEKDTSYL